MKRWFNIAFLSCMLAFSAYNRPVETQTFTSLPHIDPALQAIDSSLRKSSFTTCKAASCAAKARASKPSDCKTSQRGNT